VPQWGEKLPEIPSLIHDVLHQAKHGKLEIKGNTEELQHIKREIRRANHRTFFAILGGSLIISAALLLALDGYAPARMAYGVPLGSWVAGILGGAIFFFNWPQNRD
jgi:ubiquinone biosynthesis protein